MRQASTGQYMHDTKQLDVTCRRCAITQQRCMLMPDQLWSAVQLGQRVGMCVMGKVRKVRDWQESRKGKVWKDKEEKGKEEVQ